MLAPLSTLPQVLRAAGYATSVTGKWQLATLEFHPEHIPRAGFDSWCVWQIWRDSEKTTRYWDPCFNHDGTIRTDIADRFGPDVLADYVIDQMRAAVENDEPFYIHHNMLLPHWPIVQTPADRAAGREASLERMTNYLDRLVGRLTEAVDSLGIAEETYVIFIGDNGTDTDQPRELPDGLVRGGKRDLNDGGMHVPLLVRRPGSIAADVSTRALVDMADLFPTVCDLAGVVLPPRRNIDGVSFAPILSGTRDGSRRWVTGGIDGAWCVFDGQFRLTSRGGLIDCRKLPAEIPAEKDDPAALAARVRLGEVMAHVQ